MTSLIAVGRIRPTTLRARLGLFLATLLLAATASAAVPPTLTGVTPTSGSGAGGYPGSVTGTDFVFGAKVFIGGAEALIANFTPTLISISVPGHAAGTGPVNVVVTNPDAQSSTLTNGFTYLLTNPTISGVTPSSGSTGGVAVEVVGTDFQSGATVSFDGMAPSLVSNYTTTRIYTATPSHAAGPVRVTVTNPDGQTVTKQNAFNYIATPPTLTAISPTSGSAAGGYPGSVTGSNFVFGAKVFVGGFECSITNFTSTLISISVPGHAAGAGPANVVVTNPDGQSSTLTNGFTYTLSNPTITGVTPSSGSTGGVAVEVVGTDFVSGATVSFDGMTPSLVSNYTSTRIFTATPSHAAGPVRVTVTNPDGQSVTLQNAFTYIATAPTLTAISPTSGSAAGGYAGSVAGSDFVFGARVFIGGFECSITNFTSTLIQIFVPAHVAGTGPVDVVVTNPNGQSSTLTNGFTYTTTHPTITGVTPSSGSTAGVAVEVVGTDFQPGATVSFDGMTPSLVSNYTTTRLYTATPSHAAGPVRVTVTNPDGQSVTLQNAFTYIATLPTVTGITPTSGSNAGGYRAEVFGRDFVVGAKVRVGGGEGLITNFTSIDLSLFIPAHPGGLGPVDVEVINPDGGSSVLRAAFTYVAALPVVASIQPTSGSTGGGIRGSIHGSDFVVGATATVGGIGCLVANYTPSRLDVFIPGHPAGMADVVVTNPDGKSSRLANAFTYVSTAPSISGVKPGNARAGVPIEIDGSDFQVGAAVFIGGVQALVENFTPTALYMFAPPHAGGTVDVTVVNPDGLTATSKNAFTYTLEPARVTVASFPRTLVTTAGSDSTDSTTFSLTNAGDVATTVLLQTIGSPGPRFFNLSADSVQVPAGQSAIVSITSLLQPVPGSLDGLIALSGVGVTAGTSIPVSLLSIAPKALGIASVVAVTARVDLSAPVGTNPRGTIVYRNNGSTRAVGVLSSDAEWLTPQKGLIEIAPGDTLSTTFEIDRSRQADAANPSGSVLAKVSLVYVAGSTGNSRQILGDPSLSLSLVVPVTDTRATATTVGALPALASNEVALLVPGVGHVTGSGGKEFISDISVLNTQSLDPVSDTTLYFSKGTTVISSKQPLAGSQSLQLADVVSTQFGLLTQGTLHVRAKDTSRLAVSANVFNKSNAKGTFGTTIPVFRSNRVIAPGEQLVLTGLRKDGTSHTNLYLQEMSGNAANARFEFFDARGMSVGITPEWNVEAFGFKGASDVVPANAVMAVLTDLSGGKLQAYATPVDDASGDTWAVADWDRQYGVTGNEEMVVPVAGFLPGANGANFRTDIAVTNITRTTAAVDLTYYYAGKKVTRTLTIAGQATTAIDDVTENLFSVTGTSVGSIVVQPLASGRFVVTSRTYTASAGDPATFGTGVPTLVMGNAMRAGASQIFGGIEDSTLQTQKALAGNTYRTNVGLVEVAGQTVRVRVSVFFADGLHLSAGPANGSAVYTLAPHEFKQLSGVVRTILGPERDTRFGELHNVQVRVDVLSDSAGAVMAFVTSTDNGTNDTVFRSE